MRSFASLMVFDSHVIEKNLVSFIRKRYSILDEDQIVCNALLCNVEKIEDGMVICSDGMVICIE